MKSHLELSPDEFEMLILGVNKIKQKATNSLEIADGRVRDAARIQAKIDAGDRDTIRWYSNRQYRFYKPETIAKRKLEIEAYDSLIRKLTNYLIMYKAYLKNRGLPLPKPKPKSISWKEDCNGKIIDPDI